eukprot:3982124-Pyramimonas_sp.AAC.1
MKGFTRGSGGGLEGVEREVTCDSAGNEGVPEGIYRSSLDAHKPQNPISSEEYQGHVQGVLYIG